jgi:hypothetical protein
LLGDDRSDTGRSVGSSIRLESLISPVSMSTSECPFEISSGGISSDGTGGGLLGDEGGLASVLIKLGDQGKRVPPSGTEVDGDGHGAADELPEAADAFERARAA